MNYSKTKQFLSKTIFFLAFLQWNTSFSENRDSLKAIRHFSGVITATNNGVSLLPNFTLGKPAALFDLSLGKGKLSFDPMLRFSLDGKPWTFIFWCRYKLVNTKRFAMAVGAHPAFTFKTLNLSNNGISKDYLTTQRYLAAETTPTYIFNKNVSAGVHYLYSHGLDKGSFQNTHFVAIRGVFSNLNLSKQLALTLIPQVYYLKMDANDGIYVNASIILSKKKFPLSISSIISNALQTTIPGNKLVWNVGLNYNFNNNYSKK